MNWKTKLTLGWALAASLSPLRFHGKHILRGVLSLFCFACLAVAFPLTLLYRVINTYKLIGDSTEKDVEFCFRHVKRFFCGGDL